MIDIHSHILPDIDDGAKDLETSVRMCSIAKNNGIDTIVATPHFKAIDDIDAFIAKRNKRILRLKEALKHREIEVDIYPGAEVFIDDDIFFSKNLKRLTINSSRYLLVEFDFYNLTFRNIVDYLNEIKKMGLVPIVAHPERYNFFQVDYEQVNVLARRGVLFQINAGSLASRDGPEEFELAYAMAYHGLADFLGTDSHSSHRRPPDISNMMSFFPPDISQRNMQNMLNRFALKVLNDEEVRSEITGKIADRRGFYF